MNRGLESDRLILEAAGGRRSSARQGTGAE